MKVKEQLKLGDPVKKLCLVSNFFSPLGYTRLNRKMFLCLQLYLTYVLDGSYVIEYVNCAFDT